MTNSAHTDLINSPTIAPTDLDASNEEDQFQNGLSMNMELRQEQEVTKESLTITCKQNRRLLQTTEPAKDVSTWQPTFRIMEHTASCTYERGNQRDVFF